MKLSLARHTILYHFKILALATVLISSVASAQRYWGQPETVEINYWGRETQGSTTLFLRQDLTRQRPYFNQQNFEIERILLIAKSEFGRGEAQANIGGQLSQWRLIGGRPGDFYSRNPRTYYHIDFYNPGRMTQGAWQINLNGHIMVDRVVLIGYRDYGGGGYPGPNITYYEGGSERTQKFIETSKEFRPRRFDEPVYRIRIIGTKERVRITRAVVEMQDGRAYDLPELRTVVREGQEVGAFLQQAYVRRVVITAITDNLTGSRGEYRLDFGVRPRY
ncbi:MAG: hypothetical protein BroJett040_07320 [Oligoflexia bacterium]|nr:MAG: hypothetical protein BroJett040_07320 [Oligoflexia bacterium]